VASILRNLAFEFSGQKEKDSYVINCLKNNTKLHIKKDQLNGLKKLRNYILSLFSGYTYSNSNLYFGYYQKSDS
jgi:hypothetical protein